MTFLYYTDPYLDTFEALIKVLIPLDEEHIGIVLSQTCFFPKSGGAVGDIGTINDFIVEEAIFDEEKKNVIHPIYTKDKDTDIFKIQDSVNCSINWIRRYDVMKLHAASHIMEHFLFKLVPHVLLIGTNVNEKRDSSTYQVEEQISDVIIEELNKCTNIFISQNHTITTYPEKEGSDRRIWECGNIKIPCGGVHPRNTSEIGPVVIKRKGGGKKQKIITQLVDRPKADIF